MLSLLLVLAAAADTIPDAGTLALGQDQSDRMTVAVKLGGEANIPFVIDTGAERTIVSRQLAERLNLVKGPVRNLVTVTGTGRVNTVIVTGLELSGTKMKPIEAPALEREHIGAHGMLGLDSLQSRRVTLDFKKNEMRVAPGRRLESVDGDTIVVTGRSRYGQLILVDARFLGERVKVIVDTGSQTSIGNQALLDRLQRRKKTMALQPATISSVTGETIPAQLATVDRIEIGGVDFKNVSVAFADAEPFRRFGLGKAPALLLGMDALRLFDRVSVDFANKQVRFILPGTSSRAERVLLASR